MELHDDTTCPNCGESAEIIAICPHCGDEITTRGSAIGLCFPCFECKKDFIWNIVKSTDGTPMDISAFGTVQMRG